MISTYLKYLGWTFLLLLGHAAVAQQNPHGQLPVSSVAQPYLFLIRDPLVHDDLGLSARQRNALAALNDELDDTWLSTRNKSPQESDETNRNATAKAKSRVSSVLTPEQKHRLWQIEMWTLGTRAFMRYDLPEKLELSEDKLKIIRGTVTNTEKAANDLRKQLQTGKSRQALEKKWRELKADEQKRILAALTNRQQKKWADLLGEPIDVSKLGHVKFKAPELRSRDAWINSTVLTLKQLEGKVVALHFYAFA